jgi:hypothetical protein
MTPPARRAVQPHQARCLGRNAVRRHQLLLLAYGADKAQCMGAEADQPDRREQHQAQPRCQHHAQTLACSPWRKHQEGQRQPGGDLDPHPRHQRGRRPPPARVGAGGERERGGQRQQQQHVVMSAADGQHEQYRVQAHESGGEASRMSFIARRACYQRHGAQARGDHDRLQCPQPAGEPERHDRVAREREQRAIGRVLEGPPNERVDRIGRHLRGDVRVGVQPVQRAETGEIEVAEDVLGDQRRTEQQHQVGGDDRHPQGRPR